MSLQIAYIIGKGIWVAPTVPDMPEIKPIYNNWGEAGLYYLVNFVHPYSALSNIFNLQERNKALIEEMQFLKIGNPTKGGSRLNYPNELYRAPEFEKAEQCILNLTGLPDTSVVRDLKNDIAYYQEKKKKDMNDLNSKDEKASEDASKRITRWQNLIIQASKDLAIAGKLFREQIAQDSIESMDKIWLKI